MLKTLGFSKSYNAACGKELHVEFLRMIISGNVASLDIRVNGVDANVTKEVEKLSELKFELPFEAVNKKMPSDRFANIVTWRELNDWAKKVDALKELGITPIQQEYTSFFWHYEPIKKDINFAVPTSWLIEWLQGFYDGEVEKTEVLEHFLMNYTWNDAALLYKSAWDANTINLNELIMN